MIASLTGRVAQVGLDHVVINVNGFGMLVYATARTPVSYTHLTLPTIYSV